MHVVENTDCIRRFLWEYYIYCNFSFKWKKQHNYPNYSHGVCHWSTDWKSTAETNQTHQQIPFAPDKPLFAFLAFQMPFESNLPVIMANTTACSSTAWLFYHYQQKPDKIVLLVSPRKKKRKFARWIQRYLTHHRSFAMTCFFLRCASPPGKNENDSVIFWRWVKLPKIHLSWQFRSHTWSFHSSNRLEFPNCDECSRWLFHTPPSFGKSSSNKRME